MTWDAASVDSGVAGSGCSPASLEDSSEPSGDEDDDAPADTAVDEAAEAE